MKTLPKGTFILLTAFALSGCFSYHKINFDNSDRNIISCPKRAKEGEVVKLETVSVTDADLYVYLDCVELKPIREAYYEFTMPDHDVEIEVMIISNGLA